MKKTLALFDFDGTLTTKDSMLDFVSYSFGHIRLLKTLVQIIPEIIQVKLFGKNTTRLKEKFLKNSFKNSTKNNIEKLGFNYSQNRVDKILIGKAIDKLNWHKKEGHRVIIVSASIKEWLKPISEKLETELICTEYDFEEGRLLTKNCIGLEKVNRVQSILSIENYDEIFAYGNSKDDQEMLEIATHAYYREFN